MAELMCRGGHIGVFFFRFRCHVSVRKNNQGGEGNGRYGCRRFCQPSCKIYQRGRHYGTAGRRSGCLWGDVQVLADVEPCYMYVPFEAIKWKAAHSLSNCVPLCLVSLLSDSNQRPRDYKSRALAWVSSLHRAATTNYLCCGQALEDSKGAGRAALTRLFLGAKIGFPDETGKPMAEKVCHFMFFPVPYGGVVCSIQVRRGGV